MSKKVATTWWSRNVDQVGVFLRKYRKVRGNVPQTTYDDVDQQLRYWNREYRRSRFSRPFHTHPIHRVFDDAFAKINQQMKTADRDAVYPENAWFWFDVIQKLALHLDELNSTPTKTEMLMESIQEAIDDRIEDAGELFDSAGSAAGKVASMASDAVDAVAETGERIWSGVKTIAFIGLGLVGAAIIVPPVIRAMRD